MSLIIAGNEIIQRPTDCDRPFSLPFPANNRSLKPNNLPSSIVSINLTQSLRYNITPAFSIRSITTKPSRYARSIIPSLSCFPSYPYQAFYIFQPMTCTHFRLRAALASAAKPIKLTSRPLSTSAMTIAVDRALPVLGRFL